MSWPNWEKIAPQKLAHYANREAVAAAMGPGLRDIETEAGSRITPYDLVKQPDGRRRLVKILYSKLAEEKINYNLEKLEFDYNLQYIRTPMEIIGMAGHSGEGTCLDVVILFCGLCLEFDLLPLLVLLEGPGHALVVVSLNDDPRDWESINRLEDGFIQEGVITNRDEVVKLVKEGQSHLAVECTGFAYSETLRDGRDKDGLMSFTQATKSGLENLEKLSFKCALDIATLQARGLKPYPIVIRPMQVEEASDAVEKLGHSINGIDEMKSKLIEKPNVEAARKLNEAIEEVYKTYEVVDEAIKEYISLGLGPEPLNNNPGIFVQWAGGSFEVKIEKGRGHCSKIYEIYFLDNYLQAWFRNTLNQAEQTRMDEIFRQLSEADLDVFAKMERIGEYLTAEAAEVVNLLATSSPDQAKVRVITAFNHLQPLQRTIADEMEKLYALKHEFDAISRKV